MGYWPGIPQGPWAKLTYWHSLGDSRVYFPPFVSLINLEQRVSVKIITAFITDCIFQLYLAESFNWQPSAIKDVKRFPRPYPLRPCYSLYPSLDFSDEKYMWLSSIHHREEKKKNENCEWEITIETFPPASGAIESDRWTMQHSDLNNGSARKTWRFSKICEFCILWASSEIRFSILVNDGSTFEFFK